MTEHAQESDTKAGIVDQPRLYRLPVWTLPVIGLGICTTLSWMYGSIGGTIAVAVLATVTIATIGADIWPGNRGRHIAQAVALLTSAAIVTLAYLRVDVTRTHLNTQSAAAPLDFRNRQLSMSDLPGKVFRGAQLQGATLSGLDLRGADLSGANLSGAYLIATDLAGARLNGTSLRGADMREACLRGSILDGADLTDVNASGADVSGVVASQSIIAGARTWPAVSTAVAGVACK